MEAGRDYAAVVADVVVADERCVAVVLFSTRKHFCLPRWRRFVARSTGRGENVNKT